jgi:hypothetical protein
MSARKGRGKVALVLLWLAWTAPWSQAFAPSSRAGGRRGEASLSRRQAEPQDAAQKSQETEAVNGEGGGILLSADAKSQLFASFAALSLADQYDAVLTGLCAKILDAPDLTEAKAVTALQDPMQLVEEMNGKKIPASARSLMALVDVSVGWLVS